MSYKYLLQFKQMNRCPLAVVCWYCSSVQRWHMDNQISRHVSSSTYALLSVLPTSSNILVWKQILVINRNILKYLIICLMYGWKGHPFLNSFLLLIVAAALVMRKVKTPAGVFEHWFSSMRDREGHLKRRQEQNPLGKLVWKILEPD